MLPLDQQNHSSKYLSTAVLRRVKNIGGPQPTIFVNIFLLCKKILPKTFWIFWKPVDPGVCCPWTSKTIKVCVFSCLAKNYEEEQVNICVLSKAILAKDFGYFRNPLTHVCGVTRPAQTFMKITTMYPNIGRRNTHEFWSKPSILIQHHICYKIFCYPKIVR